LSRPGGILAAALLFGCGNLPTTSEGVAYLEILPPAILKIDIGATTQFSARALDQSGAPVDGVVVRWRSPDATIVVDDTSGVVTGVSPGTGRVQAWVGEEELVSNFFSVTVIAPPAAIRVP
jgi:uncharacterized protein YjdB